VCVWVGVMWGRRAWAAFEPGGTRRIQRQEVVLYSPDEVEQTNDLPAGSDDDEQPLFIVSTEDRLHEEREREIYMPRIKRRQREVWRRERERT